jgi:hypothetical protein
VGGIYLNGRYFTHSVVFLTVVFFWPELTYRNMPSLDRMNGRAKRIQLHDLLILRPKSTTRNTDELSSALSTTLISEVFFKFLKFACQILLLGPEGRPLPSPEEAMRCCPGLFIILEVDIPKLEVQGGIQA